MEELVIRKATDADLPRILELVYELAVYERAPEMVTAGLDTYSSSFKKGHFDALVAILAGEIVGTAIYYRRFSTWRGPFLYLEDFIVTESMRRRGIGKLLFEAFLDEARKMGFHFCLWSVLEWNETAINFYNKYDVIYDKEWYNVKLFLDTAH